MNFVYSLFHLYLSRDIMNQFTDQFPIGLIAQLVERCTGIAEASVNFFQLFRECISCLNNGDDFRFFLFLYSAVPIYEFHILIISCKEDHRSDRRNICSCEKKPEKIQACTGFEPLTCSTPVQLR